MSTVEIPGVDYAGDHPEPGGLVKVDKHFAIRYMGPGGEWKHLTLAEARALSDAGLWIVANAEGEADGLAGGHQVGADWARSARAHGDRLGMPRNRPIYFSADWDVTPAQWPHVAEALRGAASVLGEKWVGLYGGYNAIAWAVRDQVARWLWQTLAWSAGRWHPAAHIRQWRNSVSLVGGTVDLDTALVADYGQWRIGTPALPDMEDGMTTPQEFLGFDPNEDNAGGIETPDWHPNHETNPTVSLATAIELIWTHAHHAQGAAEATLAQAQTIAQALADLRTDVDELRLDVRELRAAPVIDPVAVAAAIGTRPEVLGAIAAGVAARLARIQGALTLTGSLVGGIVTPAE